MASVARIAALGPDLLVVEKSVARVAQEALLDQVSGSCRQLAPPQPCKGVRYTKRHTWVSCSWGQQQEDLNGRRQRGWVERELPDM
jgi:hypothetical protein